MKVRDQNSIWFSFSNPEILRHTGNKQRAIIIKQTTTTKKIKTQKPLAWISHWERLNKIPGQRSMYLVNPTCYHYKLSIKDPACLFGTQ